MARAKVRAAASEPVEGLWPLLEGWRWERLGDVAPVNRGRSISDLADDAAVTFVGMASVEALNGKVDVSSVRPANQVRQGFTRFASGDVLFAKITPCMENGKVAIVPEIAHGVGCGSTEFHVLTPVEVTSEYVYYWVSQRSFRETAEFHMTGTAGQKRVPPDFMRDAAIPVPPLETQRAIVARIDALFAEVEDGEAALARARADLGIWRKALLKAAVTGELTADWRAERLKQNGPPRETGTALLARILTDRRTRWHAEPRNRGKRYVEPAGVANAASTPVPLGWAAATVEQLAFVENGQTPKGIETIVATSGEVPWFKVSSMNSSGNEDGLSSSHWWLSKAEATKLGLRIHPPKTIVFPKRGGSIFTEKKRRLACSGGVDLNVMAVVPLHSTEAYLWTFFRNLSLTSISDGSNVPQINYHDVAQLVVRMPPYAEAIEIASLVDRALEATTETELDIDSQSQGSATLRQSILAAAFRGALTA